MLAQVISKDLHCFVKSKAGLMHPMLTIPFGTIVFVVKRGLFEQSEIIYREEICLVPYNSIMVVESEKDTLTWQDIQRIEKESHSRH